LVEAEHIERLPPGADPATEEFAQIARFLVLETFKGGVRPGERVVTHALIWRVGGCSISVRNDPIWVEEVERGQGQERPLSLPSGGSVLFGRGEQPFEVSMCGPSTPWEVEGEQALRVLRKLIAAKPHKSRSP
jgi:hypothetical protein